MFHHMEFEKQLVRLLRNEQNKKASNFLPFSSFMFSETKYRINLDNGITPTTEKYFRKEKKKKGGGGKRMRK